MSTQPMPILSAEKYLEVEREAEFRSEFIDGQVVAMSGGTLNHARIVRNTLAAIGNGLSGKRCEAAASDLRLYIRTFQVYTYPDIAVMCDAPMFMDKRRDTIVDATIIVEVLSRSTSSYDRGDKFAYYRDLPSFAEYLLLLQDRVGAEHHVKQSDGSWILRQINDPSAVIQLKSVGCELVLGDLYDRVEFEP